MSSMKNSHDDPRDASLEVPFSLPKNWYKESNGPSRVPRSIMISLILDILVHLESLSTSGMFFSGLIMVTRNRCVILLAIVH